MSKKNIFFLIFLFVIGFIGYRNYDNIHNGRANLNYTYYCPMHPDYTSNRPGSCPICGMDLVKKETSKETSNKRKIKFYRNPMNPEITSPVPMKDEMGMDYIPVYEEDIISSNKQIFIDENSVKYIGIKKEALKKKDFILKLNPPGEVVYDPELYQLIEEYKTNLKLLSTLNNNLDVKKNSAILETSLYRLKQAGVSDEMIKDINSSNDNYNELLIGGENVWVYLYLYEYEIGMVKAGDKLRIRTVAYPGRIFEGVVKSAGYLVSSNTRTLKLIAKVKNDGMLLKPGMYIDGEIIINLGKRLLIPSDSYIDEGRKKIIFVYLGNGRFEKREIITGKSNGEYVEVIKGLKEGEEVVISSNFLLDSESKIKNY